ncbi:hypothetical protein [Wolbachia endosymbiont of Chironomus riparius]|nr:hypothetical protein [Wolbachia endosymbiont of Chironomus riparius]
MERNQVLAEGEVSNEVIEAGIKIFDSTLLSNVNVNQLGMCMSRR